VPVELSRLGAALVLALLISACASRGPVIPAQPPGAPSAVELAETPFFPQSEYQCGPAALATVLNAADVAISPDELAPQVYIPNRRGTLQAELVAAARRHERIPYQSPATLPGLLAEVAAGRPMLVLQNLGWGPWPIWHYAVVIGFDAAADTVILRSGTEERLVVPASDFARSWQRAGNWGLLVLRPGELPESTGVGAYLKAVAGVETVGQWQAAHLAYIAGTDRWPDNATLWLGLGNTEYYLGQPEQAYASYSEALRLAPQSPATRNNLAQVLSDLGCYPAALTTLAPALDNPLLDPGTRNLLEQTQAEILRARGATRTEPPSICPKAPAP
jgi:tetratricopeptide (TPR) repeat protein